MENGARSRCSPMSRGAVISAIDADSIYQIPLMLHAQDLDRSSSINCTWMCRQPI